MKKFLYVSLSYDENDTSSCTQDNQLSYGGPDFTKGIVNVSHRESEREAYIDTAMSTQGAKPVWEIWGPTEPTPKIHNCEQQKNQKVDEDKLARA